MCHLNRNSGKGKKIKKVLTKDENYQIVIHEFPCSIAKMFYLKC